MAELTRWDTSTNRSDKHLSGMISKAELVLGQRMHQVIIKWSQGKFHEVTTLLKNRDWGSRRSKRIHLV